MSVTPISSVSRRSDEFTALQSTLQAGNLAGAQAAFAAFLQDVQKTSQVAGPNSLFAPGSQTNKDLQTLGGALRSSNLSGAQSAFASLQKDIQTAGQPGSVPLPRAHHPLTRAEVASGGVAVLENAAPGSAGAQTISNILNLKP